MLYCITYYLNLVLNELSHSTIADLNKTCYSRIPCNVNFIFNKVVFFFLNIHFYLKLQTQSYRNRKKTICLLMFVLAECDSVCPE